jgi:hypothetical protein
MANRIQLRRDTAGNWNRINPVLSDGEPGLDITNNKIKLGDGTTPWNALPYLTSAEHSRLVNGGSVLILNSNGDITLPHGSTLGTLNSYPTMLAYGSAPHGGPEWDWTDSNDPTNLWGGTILRHAAWLNNEDGFFIGMNENQKANVFTGSWSFGANGTMTFPGGTTFADIPNAEATWLTVTDDTDLVVRTRTNGIGNNFWTFGHDGNLTVPTNGVITAAPGYTGSTFGIADIVQADPVYPVVITTSVDHALYSGTKIRITGITSTVELNDRDYYVTTPAANQLQLYSDPACTVPVFGSTNTPYFTAGNRTVSASGNSLAGNNPGFTDRSIQFSGVTSYVETPASTDFNIGTGDFAVSFWVYQTNYANYPRLFSFGTYAAGDAGSPLALSSESNVLYFWLNGGIYGYGLPSGAMSLNAWHHLVVTRYSGVMYLAIDGAVTNHWPNTDTIPTGTVPLVVANQTNHDAGLTGYIRDFKFNVGQGIDLSSLSYTVPSAPATADTGYTKLLLVDYASDSSGSGLVPGGGSVVAEYRGADLTLELTSPANTDTGDIKLVNRAAQWRFSESGQLTLPDGGTAAGSRQQLIHFTATDITNHIRLTSISSLILVTPDPAYTGSDTLSIFLPTAGVSPGTKISIVNDYQGSVNVYLAEFEGPWVSINAWENRDYVLIDHPVDGMYWWETNSYSW